MLRLVLLEEAASADDTNGVGGESMILVFGASRMVDEALRIDSVVAVDDDSLDSNA